MGTRVLTDGCSRTHPRAAGRCEFFKCVDELKCEERIRSLAGTVIATHWQVRRAACTPSGRPPSGPTRPSACRRRTDVRRRRAGGPAPARRRRCTQPSRSSRARALAATGALGSAAQRSGVLRFYRVFTASRRRPRRRRRPTASWPLRFVCAAVAPEHVSVAARARPSALEAPPPRRAGAGRRSTPAAGAARCGGPRRVVVGRRWRIVRRRAAAWARGRGGLRIGPVRPPGGLACQLA
jgi:hypothetical protein